MEVARSSETLLSTHETVEDHNLNSSIPIWITDFFRRHFLFSRMCLQYLQQGSSAVRLHDKLECQRLSMLILYCIPLNVV
jgi:hypothetical protein